MLFTLQQLSFSIFVLSSLSVLGTKFLTPPTYSSFSDGSWFRNCLNCSARKPIDWILTLLEILEGQVPKVRLFGLGLQSFENWKLKYCKSKYQGISKSDIFKTGYKRKYALSKTLNPCRCSILFEDFSVTAAKSRLYKCCHLLVNYTIVLIN